MARQNRSKISIPHNRKTTKCRFLFAYCREAKTQCMARAHLQRGMNKYCRKTTEVTYFDMERQKVFYTYNVVGINTVKDDRGHIFCYGEAKSNYARQRHIRQ